MYLSVGFFAVVGDVFEDVLFFVFVRFTVHRHDEVEASWSEFELDGAVTRVDVALDEKSPRLAKSRNAKRCSHVVLKIFVLLKLPCNTTSGSFQLPVKKVYKYGFCCFVLTCCR